MSRTFKIAAVFFAVGLIAAGCAKKAQTGSKLPTSIGPGEGALSLIAWVGYVESGKTDPKVDWIHPFEKETNCKVTAKIANTSDEMVNLMRLGGGTQYDGVSASGDASNRLIAAGNVAEVNVDLIPAFPDAM